MRRVLFAMVSLFTLGLAACSGGAKDGECSTNEDCAAQAEQGYGPICVEGRCQECGQDGDCKAGFVCQEFKCAPKPECQTDADCQAGKTCQSGVCQGGAQPECSADADCGEGKSCQGGMCVAAEAPAAAPTGGCTNLGEIFFGFDEYSLSSDATAILDQHAACFKESKPAKVTIAGNCDERGTTEYNLQLGQRRADAAKKYLVDLGVDGNTLNTVSYGEEQPTCTESTEDCWAKNRRDTFTAE
jgi:peptidoglycan-associated lipoprotein